MCTYVYVYEFKDSKLSFHKQGVVVLQKYLTSINSTSKNQVFDCMCIKKHSFSREIFENNRDRQQTSQNQQTNKQGTNTK